MRSASWRRSVGGRRGFYSSQAAVLGGFATGWTPPGRSADSVHAKGRSARPDPTTRRRCEGCCFAWKAVVIAGLRRERGETRVRSPSVPEDAALDEDREDRSDARHTELL